MGTHVGIDGHALLTNGRYNVNCGSTQVDGLQIKDVQIIGGTTGNVFLQTGCSNVRMIGDLISGAGSTTSQGFGVYFAGKDLSIEGGVIEQSRGIGLYLYTAKLVSVTGMYFDDNGSLALSGPFPPAILVYKSMNVSVCNNHFQRSSGNDAGGTGSVGKAHIQFSGPSSDIEFCGNVYRPDTDNNTGASPRPNYVYDSDGTASLTSSGFYKNPAPQAIGVVSPAALALVPPFQVLPLPPRNYLSGLALSNDSANPNTTVDIAKG